MAISSSVSRRDILLMGTGLAVLSLGRFADSHFNNLAADDSVGLQTACARLSQLPADIGSWTSEEGELSPDEIKAAGIKSYVRRDYKDRVTGYRVTVTLLCGLAGPMSVHPPTACFEGVGYTLCFGPTIVNQSSTDGTQKAEFNKSAFQQGDSTFPEVVRVYWAWGHDGSWQAPPNPRLEFRGQPFLYKLYVTDRSLAEPGAATLPQIETFLETALPVLSATLHAD